MIDQARSPSSRGRSPNRSCISSCWRQTESIFALSNGHIGLRGNLDEGEPHAIPGTYLNGFFETLPLPYAERATAIPSTASR